MASPILSKRRVEHVMLEEYDRGKQSERWPPVVEEAPAQKQPGCGACGTPAPQHKSLEGDMQTEHSFWRASNALEGGRTRSTVAIEGKKNSEVLTMSCADW